VEASAVTVTEALELARLQGVEVTLDGNDLVLKAEAAPPPGLLAILGRGKWDIVSALRMREADERRRIVQWVNDNFAASPPGVCAHCGGGPRPEDPSSCCSSETTGARCTRIVMHRGWRTERRRRAEYFD
jgi:hypothetical protein